MWAWNCEIVWLILLKQNQENSFKFSRHKRCSCQTQCQTLNYQSCWMIATPGVMRKLWRWLCENDLMVILSKVGPVLRAAHFTCSVVLAIWKMLRYKFVGWILTFKISFLDFFFTDFSVTNLPPLLSDLSHEFKTLLYTEEYLTKRT